MWVADMDFPAPKPVVDALVARAKHGIYGYTETPEGYHAAIQEWMWSRHGWEIHPQWIVTTPGVVSALALLVRAFLKPGEKAIIQTPVYYPFFHVLEINDIEVVRNPLIVEDGKYRMDFEDLQVKARDPQTKMLILCSPHNPVGRIWTREELTRLAEICAASDLLIVSDEIHADLSFKPFTPFGTLEDKFTGNLVVCTAASKTFNLAGLGTSNIIIPDRGIRDRFSKYIFQNGVYDTGFFGRLATEIAYTQGAEWLDQLLDYLAGTLSYMEKFFRKNLPQIRMTRPEGTYLAWLDCRAIGMTSAALSRFFFDSANVYLENGAIFGPDGDGFLRMNIATPRKLVKEALQRMKVAVDSL
jgi:cystathionine beta-lyase